MVLWLLNNLSTAYLIALVVGGTTVLAIVVALLLRKAFPNMAESGFEEITGVLRADVFALLYTIILALVIADQSGNFAAASSTVSSEANALAELTNATQSFPIAAQIPLNEGIRQYVHAVVEDEWPSMTAGEQSPRAAAALEGLYAVYRGFEPATPAQEAFYGTVVDNLGQIALSRRERLQQSSTGLSPLLRFLLIVGAIVFIVLAFPASVRSLSTQLVIVGAVAAFVSFALLLTFLLDYPFSGELSVDNSSYKTGSLAVFWASEEPRTLQQGETEEELHTGDLIGVWNSDAFGVTVFKQIDGEVRGLYRLGGGGTISGTVSDGVFRGWWCEGPTRKAPDDAGEVEWRLVNTVSGERLLAGRWRYGTEGFFRGGWDLRSIGGPVPADLAGRFDDLSTFCRRP